jgi:hypothetical protein
VAPLRSESQQWDLPGCQLRTPPSLKKFVASSHLRVRRILDLAPVGARAVRMVTTARELAYDALEVVRTRDLEEVPPACLDVVHVQQARPHWRDQSAQPRGTTSSHIGWTSARLQDSASSAGALRLSQGIATDMATPVSRCDSCPCGAELGVLLNRFAALMVAVEDLLLELRASRTDQARRRTTSSQGERDAVLLLVITQMFAADPFQAGEVIARASDSAVLRQALNAAGAVNGKKLGHCLERLERRDVDGAQILRLGENNRGSSGGFGGDRTHNQPSPL